MIDCGASENFIDQEYALANRIPLQAKTVPRKVLTVDGSEVVSGPVTHDTLVDLDVNNHHENIRLHCITIGNTPIILGLPWLKLHDPTIWWKDNQVSFTSDRCAKKCLELSPQATTVPEEKAAAQYFKDIPLDEVSTTPEPAISMINAAAFNVARKYDTIGTTTMREVNDTITAWEICQAAMEPP